MTFQLALSLRGRTPLFSVKLNIRTIAHLAQVINTTHPIAHWRGHNEIAPGRKTDPGPYFDWDRLLKEAAIDRHMRPQPDTGLTRKMSKASEHTTANLYQKIPCFTNEKFFYSFLLARLLKSKKACKFKQNLHLAGFSSYTTIASVFCHKQRMFF
jgi:hypothetical protein